MTNVTEAVHRQAVSDPPKSLAVGDVPQSAAKTTAQKPIQKTDGPMKRFGKPLLCAVVALALTGGGYYAWLKLRPPGLPEGIASGNGRIEATEIDVDAKIAGRITDILVDEGDPVSAGQVLVHMDTRTLEAQRREAEAQLQRATYAVETAEAVVRQREGDRMAAKALDRPAGSRAGRCDSPARPCRAPGGQGLCNQAAARRRSRCEERSRRVGRASAGYIGRRPRPEFPRGEIASRRG